MYHIELGETTKFIQVLLENAYFLQKLIITGVKVLTSFLRFRGSRPGLFPLPAPSYHCSLIWITRGGIM
jgi:hypothetical protein